MQIAEIPGSTVPWSAISTMRLSTISHFEHTTTHEAHNCNEHVRLSDFHDNDHLHGRKLIPTDSSGINYENNNHQKSERKRSLRTGRLSMIRIIVWIIEGIRQSPFWRSSYERSALWRYSFRPFCFWIIFLSAWISVISVFGDQVHNLLL
jgi:hypothetical protein